MTIPKSWEKQSERSSEVPDSGLSTVNVLLTIKPHVLRGVQWFFSHLCLNLVYGLFPSMVLVEPTEPRGAFFGFVLSYYWSPSVQCLMCPKIASVMCNLFCHPEGAFKSLEMLKSRLTQKELLRFFFLSDHIGLKWSYSEGKWADPL